MTRRGNPYTLGTVTLVHLIDPALFARHNGSDHADLYVAWDALELPVQGLGLRLECWDLFLTEAGRSWRTCHDAENELRDWARGRLSGPARAAAARVLTETLLFPVWERLDTWNQQHPGGPPEGVQALIAGDWLWGNDHIRNPTPEQWGYWAGLLAEAAHDPTCYEYDRENRTVSYLLRGLFGLFSCSEEYHGVPVFVASPKWGDLLEIVRWIYWCVWCADQKGEFYGE